jgi:hypothetical protein
MTEENGNFADELRNAWIYGRHFTTLPTWTRPQVEGEGEEAFPDIDANKRRTFVRRLVLLLGCNDCEKKNTEECDFHVCVTSLMAGSGGGG